VRLKKGGNLVLFRRDEAHLIPVLQRAIQDGGFGESVPVPVHYMYIRYAEF